MADVPARPLVLGIETSCDETAAAVVRDGTEVLANVVHSQIQLHERYRGVVPEIASRSHATRIRPILETAFERAGVGPADLDAVAVTHRPGMIGCLLVGMAAAKTLSWRFGLPLLGVDHVQAHIHSALMAEPDLPLPALVLVASGGHTALYVLREPGHAERVGTTRDDAAGEALDKGSAILGLPYPGGPAIQKVAVAGNPKALRLPRSMLGDSLDFSFSGLKTALLYHLRGNGLVRPMPDLDDAEVADLAASYQEAVVDALVRKLERAAARFPEVRSLAIGGGVARNTLLRERLATARRLGALQRSFPPLDLCSDNGAMIAGLATCRWRQGHVDDLELQPMATTRR